MPTGGFRIGDLCVAVTGDGPIAPVDGFPPTGTPDLELASAVVDESLSVDSAPISDCDTWSVHRDGDRISFVVKVSTFDPPEVARVDLDDGSPHGRLLIRRDLAANPIAYPLDQLLAIHLLHPRGGALLHAACVVHNECAFVLAGASGAGKTTFSRSVAGRSDVTVLTDERVALRRGRDGWIADGTPWAGEGAFARNASRPLAAIFLLEKADADERLRITPAQALARLMACHFPPTWMGDDPDVHLAALEQLVREVPCYRLRNRLGGDAADMVFDPRLAPPPGRAAVARDLLAAGRAARLTVFGSSMAPAIRSGDVVTLEPATSDQVEVGDVVLAEAGADLRLHRLVGRDPLTTRGDAAAAADPAVDVVFGRVTHVATEGRLWRRIKALAGRMLWYT